MISHITRQEYPVAYYVLKSVAGVITLWAALLVADWYIPGQYSEDRVIETFTIDPSSESAREYWVITELDTISVERGTFNQIQQGMTIRSERSQILGKYKWMELDIGPDETTRIRLSNIFLLNGFFAKFLLTSIFTLVFLTPTYWMISLLALDVVVVLVFSGLPMVLVFGIVFILAVIVFGFQLYRQRKQ